MAMDQLGLYNEALGIIGQRELASLTENREPRHRLDSVYGRAAVNYCLELVKPNFASQVTTLSSPSADSTFDWSHSKPADYITLVDINERQGAIYSDSKLDQPISRYIIETDSFLVDYETIYIHYIKSGGAITAWSPAFFRVVAAYLATEIATRFSPEDFEKADAVFTRRVTDALTLEAAKVPHKRSSAAIVTLTAPWRRIYNDALLIMGLEEINSNTDDSNRRAKLDRALNADIVEEMLEDSGWQFGMVSSKIDYDPSAEPAWGPLRAHAKPTDLHRLDGIYQDEYMTTPLKVYKDEDQYWFCDLDSIYISYVTTDFLVNPSSWPAYTRRLVAARMAKDAAHSLRDEGADYEKAKEEFKERDASAKSNDAMASPPHILARGSWVRARWIGSDRNRP